jgi:hypothetical protein
VLGQSLSLSKINQSQNITANEVSGTPSSREIFSELSKAAVQSALERSPLKAQPGCKAG